jgi:hypothetical protein
MFEEFPVLIPNQGTALQCQKECNRYFFTLPLKYPIENLDNYDHIINNRLLSMSE